MPKRVEILKRKFTNSVGLPFRELLPESTIVEALEAQKIEYRNRLFNPIVTLWAFLSQVLDTDNSLQNAVSRIIEPLLLPVLQSWSQKASKALRHTLDCGE